MPSSTRSNKDKHLLFSVDPAHLERTIRKDQRSTSLDTAAFTSTDSRTQPSTDIRPSSSTDLHRSTSIDTTPRTSIDHQSRNMVAIVILRQEDNGNLYDQDGHLRNATGQKLDAQGNVIHDTDATGAAQPHEKLGEGDFEVESSMSFGGSHWCRPMSMDTHRSTDHDEDRSTDYSKNRSTSSAESTAECSAVRIMTHEEFAEKHPHPPSPFYVKIVRPHEPAVDRQRETDIDRLPSPPIDRRAPLTYRMRLPSIDNDRINALRPPPKPLVNLPEPTTNPSDTTPEPMQVDEATEGRRLRKRKEKIPKNLKREANEKEMDGFTKRVLRIPVEKPFDEVYFTHRLWMFFRETKETEEDIRRMFHHVRERMKLRITLKKKSDPGKFAIPCVVKGIEFPHALCDTGASVSILPKVTRMVICVMQQEFAEKHPHPPSSFYVKIDRPPSPPIDRRAPLTYRVRLPSIDNDRINALRPPPKHLANLPEPTTNPSDTTLEPMQVDEATEGRRETKETEEDIRRMFHHVRERMKLRITLKTKSDPGKFAIPCVVKGIEFPHALCDTGASVSILPKVMADQLGLKIEPSSESFTFVDIDRPPSPPIDRRAPLTYRVRLPSIDNDRINALRPPPKPLANPPEPTTNPSDTTPEPMQVDEATEGRRLRKRKEKIPKNLKREANEKEMDGFTNRVLKIPVEKPFDEVYFTHRLWMFFRETKETEEDIGRMFHHVRERMKLRITLKKKSDPGKQHVNLVELGNDLGYIAACDCGAEYEIEYSESIDTHTASSIDSNDSPTTDEHYPTSLDGKHPVDHFTLPDQC
ncbi:hypothetical protein DY000_02007133 [Brassica cretica]|uniref:Aspartic peptidase DDI1-type domain-containing protein n=1 Tax=Brassica cretica TaxID=69181 RepID=A0ABQ7C4V9_BRACR|nr:hypothetical protein DY000_02007133 [Brassica cretica]